MSTFQIKKKEKSKKQIAEKTAMANERLAVLSEKEKNSIKTISILEKQIQSLDIESLEKNIKLKEEIKSLEKEIVTLRKDVDNITGEYSSVSRSLMETDKELTEYRDLLTQADKEYKDGLARKEILLAKLFKLETEQPLKLQEVDHIEENIKEKGKELRALKVDVEQEFKELVSLQQLTQRERISLEEAIKSSGEHKESFKIEIEDLETEFKVVKEFITKNNLVNKENIELSVVQLEELKVKKELALKDIKIIENREKELLKRERNFSIANEELKVKTRILKILMKENEIKDLL